MSARIKGFVVTLKQDISEDQAKSLSRAIRLFAGVVSVDAVEGDASDWIATSRERSRIHAELLEFLSTRIYPERQG